ncbi:MAG: hypothetical protein KatS3mg060_1454 [Dehalococcoidia bacterium]|nr:MAG: hypothetical protein KatS3mg060_1454 [Dehalococcoidia bacterium]
MRVVGSAALIAVIATIVVSSSLTSATSPRGQRSAVQQKHPILGVHTRLTDEVEPWKIQRTMQMVREMGATWVVEYFPWTYVEPAKGQYDWAHVDLVVDAAHDEGLTLVARIDNVPPWARPAGTTDRYIDARGIQDYGDFLAAFVRRYLDRVRHYIVWNEQNTTMEWGFRPVDPEGYVELLKVAYTRIKEADPSALVLPGALAPTLERSRDALDDLVYLQRMYDAGAKDYFDLMNIHSYGLRSPPDDPPSPNRINFARAALIREVMVRNGDGEKLAFISEAGWNDHPRWTKAVRPAQRVEYTVRAIEKAEAEWPWLVGLCFWTFRLPFPARNYNDQYTFVDGEFRPKPVYEAVRDWAHR